MSARKMSRAEIIARLLADRTKKYEELTKPNESEFENDYDPDIDYYTRQSNREIRAENGKDYSTKE